MCTLHCEIVMCVLQPGVEYYGLKLLCLDAKLTRGGLVMASLDVKFHDIEHS